MSEQVDRRAFGMGCITFEFVDRSASPFTTKQWSDEVERVLLALPNVEHVKVSYEDDDRDSRWMVPSLEELAPNAPVISVPNRSVPM